MTRRIVRRALPAAVILLALGLSACAPGTPATDDASATTSPEPSASAIAEPTPTPTPTAPAGVAATCDTLLTPDAYAKIEADGLEPTSATPFDPLAVRITEEGGLICSWGRPQTDLILSVAQVSAGDDETVWANALAEGGYSQTGNPVPGAYTGQPDAAMGATPTVIVADGTVTFVNLPAYAGWVRPAS